MNSDELDIQLDNLKSTLKSASYSPSFFNNKRPCRQAIELIEDAQRCIHTFTPTRGLTL